MSPRYSDVGGRGERKNATLPVPRHMPGRYVLFGERVGENRRGYYETSCGVRVVGWHACSLRTHAHAE
jgi:hypothetical protein